MVKGKKPRRIRLRLSLDYRAFARHTVFTRFRVRGVPRGARVKATCRFRGGLCAGKARRSFTRRRANNTVDLAKRYVRVDLALGTRITLRVTKAHMIGAVRIVTIRSRKAPGVAKRCLPPGATKPRKRC